jgi:hypothetical protein
MRTRRLLCVGGPLDGQYYDLNWLCDKLHKRHDGTWIDYQLIKRVSSSNTEEILAFVKPETLH